MISPLLWIGAAIFVVGVVIALAHQNLAGPNRANWIDYAALFVIACSGGVFVAGAMLSAG